jgi:8-oxo-dGTP diphosphatase
VTRVVAGVAVRDGRVLVCRRAAGRPHAGRWEFPGGKLEGGETFEAALRRELVEELGVDVPVGRELWRTDHRYPEREPIEIRFFAVDDPGDGIDPAHFAELRWQPLERLGDLDFLEADREIVARLANGSLRVAAKRLD